MDVVTLVSLEGDGSPHVKGHFLSFGHRKFAESLFKRLQEAEAVEVLDAYPHKDRITCCVGNVSVDVLLALPPESLSLEDLRMDEPGVWIKTYSLNLAKCRWAAGQPEVVRNAARLMKLWARAVCQQESTAPLAHLGVDNEEDDRDMKINMHALLVVIAALHRSCLTESAVELCAHTWQLLSSLRVDLLVLVSFDTHFVPKLSCGPRFHRELVASLNWQGCGVTGLAIEDIMQPDRLYCCSETIRLETIATYAACALSRLTVVDSWSQMTDPCDKADPGLRDVFALFVPFCATHFSHFLEVRGRIRCPSGHDMLPGAVACNLVCDDCQLTVDGSFTVGCRQCDFDLCKDCVQADASMACHFPVPFQKWPPDSPLQHERVARHIPNKP